MAGPSGIRPTRVESGLAVLLLVLSVVEMLFSDEQPTPDLTRAVMAVVPPVLVAFSRSWPPFAAAGMAGVLLLESVHPGLSGTFGSGLAWLVIMFGVGAWATRPWPWATGLALAGVLSDLRAVDRDSADLVVDLAMLGFALTAGRVVHRRARRADVLDSRLRLADAEHDSHVKEAVTRERALIARELHDIVAHAVSLMVVQAGTARPVAERVDAELAAVLRNIEESGREALTELRRLLRVMRTDDQPDLQPVPDLGRLDDLLDSVRRAGLEVDATVDVPDGVPAGVALCAYRVVQEGLTNAMRYAAGSAVDVRLRKERQTLTVTVQDHGGTHVGGTVGAGTGLEGLRERVLLCGGQLTSGPAGPGHLLEATLPMTDAVLPGTGPS